MKHIYATSKNAVRAHALVMSLQQRFVTGLEKLSLERGGEKCFTTVEWLRDGGLHGGGERYETSNSSLFGRGSVNVSQVHYDDNPEKKLGSATAISTIIHPQQPLAPSVHIHISWTDMKDGSGYWRMMADLNPSLENTDDTVQFLSALKEAAPLPYDEAVIQGGNYFFIPALDRHRGVAHFYLENYNTGCMNDDYLLAKSVGEAAIDSYLRILNSVLKTSVEITAKQREAQFAYHTLYFFQVLTLDRGTTTGLLVHNQNDIGIMGSLPAYVDRELLCTWVKRMKPPQTKLLEALIDSLPAMSPCLVDERVKKSLADVVRHHYMTHPDAIDMQASGNMVPTTVNNHKS
ncbi:MAG: coproporphyrinogen III oxidase [Mariprofundaceae bacterium]